MPNSPSAPTPSSSSVVSSRTVDLTGLFSSGQLFPAPVQRDYVWTKENCQALLDDLERAFKATTTAHKALAQVGIDPSPQSEPDSGPADETAPDHDDNDSDEALAALMPPATVDAAPPVPGWYLGTIIVHEAAADVLHIYDGLQRLTTMTMLIAVLRDLVSDADLRSRLDALIAVSRAPRNMTYILKLRLGDWRFREEVQKLGEAAKSRKHSQRLTDTEHRLRDATYTCKTVVKAWKADKRAAFARWLLSEVEVTRVTVTDPRLARRIFVSTNLQGVLLRPSELFKGQLLEMAPDEASATAIAQKWAGIKAAVGDDLDGLLRAIDFLARLKPQGDDALMLLADHIHNTTRPDSILLGGVPGRGVGGGAAAFVGGSP